MRVKTPVFDRLAREGVLFERAYVAAAWGLAAGLKPPPEMTGRSFLGLLTGEAAGDPGRDHGDWEPVAAKGKAKQ